MKGPISKEVSIAIKGGLGRKLIRAVLLLRKMEGSPSIVIQTADTRTFYQSATVLNKKIRGERIKKVTS
jgi:hypothetical protein